MLKENERTYHEAFSALGVTKLADIVPAIVALKSDLAAVAAKATKAEEQGAKLAATIVEREAELAAIKLADTKREHETLIAELSEAGKLPKALHEWAGTISLDALRQFGEAAPVVKPEASNPNPSTSGEFTITPEMRRVAKMMNLPLEKFAETQKADAAKMAQLREDV